MKVSLIKTGDTILFLKNFNFLLLYKTTVSLFTSDHHFFRWIRWRLATDKWKKWNNFLFETKKIRPEQKKDMVNLTLFRIEKNIVVFYNLIFSLFFFCFSEWWRLSGVSDKPNNAFISLLDWINLLIFMDSDWGS